MTSDKAPVADLMQMDAAPANYLIRPAVHGDIHTLTKLSQDLTNEVGREFSGANAAAIAGICSGREDAFAWLAASSADLPPVGYGVLTLGYSVEHGGVDGFVDELYIAQHARRQGLGTALMSLVETEAQRRGVNVLHLEAESNNPKAQALYQRLGYLMQQRILMSKPLLP